MQQASEITSLTPLQTGWKSDVVASASAVANSGLVVVAVVVPGGVVIAVVILEVRSVNACEKRMGVDIRRCCCRCSGRGCRCRHWGW
jgi:hypothetical protein